MATEIKLPDLGEGIADVTVSRWRTPVGSTVAAGDVILEVATDKVDTEIQAPASGVLLQVNFQDGELAPATAVLGYIGAAGEHVGTPVAAPSAAPAPSPAPGATAPTDSAAAAAEEGVRATPVAKRVAVDKGVNLAAVSGTGPGGQVTKHDVLTYAEGGPLASQPLPGDLADVASLSVRRAAADLNVNLKEVAHGRPLSALTKFDVLSFAASRAAGRDVRVEPAYPPPAAILPAAGQPVPPATLPAASQPRAAAAVPAVKPAGATPLKPGEELVKLSRMRAAVARNTIQSAFAAPHVTTMWDVDMTAVVSHRAAHKKEFAAAGVNLTVTAYLFKAILAGLKAVPAANATWTEDGVIIKRYYNIGMATALPMDQVGIGGLIVPVLKNVQDLNLMGIARAVNELADRARRGELRPEDLADGTFTLSNYGTSGSRFQTPIIVQPQVGILGVGVIEKRAVVVSAGSPLEANLGDYMAFKPMTTLGFSYDHRVLDGATADAFCAAVKKRLEEYR